MAARKRRIRHDEDTRNKIQAAQIINRLEANLMGKIDLSPAQVTSAKILLAKVLPDLSQVDSRISGQVDQKISSEPVSEADWAAKYGSNQAEDSADKTH